MANVEEKVEKTVSLADLGLEDTETPAEKIKADVERQSIKVKEEIKKVVKQENGNTITVERVEQSADDLVEKPAMKVPRPDRVYDENNNPKHVEQPIRTEIASTNNDDEPKYKTVSIKDIAKVAPRSERQVNPIRKTLDGLYDLADKGIAREKKELTAPGGRIDEGKQKYIQDRYETLIKRSKNSKNLAKKIKYFQDAMETDPSFDGATEYEKKGYILFKVAKDTSIGIDDKSFGLPLSTIKGYRDSAEASKSIESVTASSGDSDDNDNMVVLSDDSSVIPIRSSDDVAKDSAKRKKATEELQPTETVYDDLMSATEEDDDDEDVIQPANTEIDLPVVEEKSPSVEVKNSELEADILNPDTDITDEMMKEVDNDIKEEQDEAMKEYGLTTKQMEDMRNQFIKEVATTFNQNSSDDLKDIEEGAAVNITTAMKLFMQQDSTAVRPIHSTWPLMFTGVPYVSTAFSGQELIQFIDDLREGFYTEDNSNPEPTIEQLISIFSALYRHTVNRGKPTFQKWLKSIAASDFYGLIFSQYNAVFKTNNYISYQCSKRGCARLFLEKKDIMDMVTFPNDETKERFNKIMRGESVLTGLYKTPPVPINDYFAFSFMTPSIYSMNFETQSLSPIFRKKYSAVTGFMPMIADAYIIDKVNGKMHRIDFGQIENSIEKTTMRKVKGLMKILVRFDINQRSRIYGEYLKVLKNMQKDDIGFQIPKTVCPVCKTEIPAVETDPIGALFTRARLSIDAASTPVLL